MGFTLIEVLVYLALFSIVMSGVIASAYQVFESAGRDRTRSLMQEEGDFVSAKIDWALSGAQIVSAPAAPPSGGACTESNTLSVTKWDATSIVINLSGSDIVIARNGGQERALNASDVAVSALLFKHCYKGGVMPESVVASYTVSARTPSGVLMSRDFTMSSYLKK